MKNIHTAIRRLDLESLTTHLPESLSEQETEDLLLIADQAVAKEIAKSAKEVATATPAEVAEIAIAHSARMQNYLYIRATLCGDDLYEEDDQEDIGIF